MPLYEYRCTKCGHTFDKIQSFSSEPERECPKCGGLLERPLTAPSFQFKGGGWYVNDYAGGRSSATVSSSSSESTADSKPAATESSAPAAPATPAAPASTTSSSTPAGS